MDTNTFKITITNEQGQEVIHHLTRWGIVSVIYPNGTQNNGDCQITLAHNQTLVYRGGDIQKLISWLNQQ